MKAGSVSLAYAKSLFQLGKEKNINIVDELTRLQVAINENNNLETLLFLDLFTIEEKLNVMNEILGKLNLSDISKNIVKFLLSEKRFSLFPLIYKDLIVLDDHEKGFLRGTVRGNQTSISESDEKMLTEFLSKELGKKIVLDYKNDVNVSAGYRVSVGDFQLDATLDNQLNQLRENILGS